MICYGEGRGITEIAKLLDVNFKTVVNWITKFMSGGIDWIMGKHYQGRGRKEKLTKAQQKRRRRNANRPPLLELGGRPALMSRKPPLT